MDEKNEKLQPQQEALPPETPAEQPGKATVTPAATEICEEAPPKEESTKQAPAEEAPAKEEPAKREPVKQESVKEDAAGKPLAPEHAQAFSPIREPAKKATDATVAFSAVKNLPDPVPEAPAKAPEVSYFDGSSWAYIGWWALAALITVATLGIGLAWGQCMFWRYRAKHTVVCGRRLTFDGTGLQLFENYLVWGVLTVITLGIYGLWVPVKVRSWYCGHLFMTGYRRRHSQKKAPTWRNVLVFLAAVLCFAMLLTGIIIVATGNAPWQEKDPGEPTPPPASSTMDETAPPTTPAPTTTPEPTTTPAPTTPKPTEAPKKTYTVRANSGLTLRAAPDRSSKALSLIPNGTVVTEEDHTTGWVKVTYNEITGWVSKDYLREN